MRNVCRLLAGLACTLLLLGVTLPGQATDAPDRSRAPPVPLMGWSGYNFAGPRVTEALVMRNAELMVSDGLAAAGYRYVLLDGGWNLRARGPAGNLRADPAKFPHGMPMLVSFVHGLGLKFGLYLSAGVTNCAGYSAGSWGHYAQDAALLASWGVDEIKLDYCEVPVTLTASAASAIARQIAQAVAATDRPMVLDVNVANGRRNHALSWTWAGKAGASEWRVSSDIRPGLPAAASYIVRDVLVHTSQSNGSSHFILATPAHGVAMVRITPATPVG